MPVVVTVHSSAAECRPRNAKCLLKYKRATTATERQEQNIGSATHNYLDISEWGVADVGGDEQQFGLSGSPTKVKKIENIVFQAKETKHLTAEDADVEALIVELIGNHTIG
jgi:electron transfer flavoprotein beta subunit